MQTFRSGENQESLLLWRMSRDTFNAWRRQNDLPRLLVFLKEILPYFQEWLDAHGLIDADFIAANHTSQLLRGEGQKHLVDLTEPKAAVANTSERITTVMDQPGEDALAAARRAFSSYDATIHSSKPFQPYFNWLRKVKRIRYFKVKGDLNNRFVDDLDYSLWQNLDLTYSRSSLFTSHPVLKLGGATISVDRLDDRNLDFVDLDGLTLTGSGPTYTTSIAYTSCRKIAFIDADKPFLTFEKCTVDSLRIEKCRMQNLHFVDCKVPSLVIGDSRLMFFWLERSSMGGAQIDNTELIGFQFTDPPSYLSHGELSDEYKRLRLAFQQKGNHHDVTKYFYLERKAELLSNLFPILPFHPQLPQRRWADSYLELWRKTRAGQYTTRQALQFVAANALAYVQLLLPNHFLRFVLAKARVATQIIDYAVWGFGERPARVFFWMAAVLAAFSAKYYFLGGKGGNLKGDVSESLYCSAFNFATMGCDFKTSFDSIEGILGATLLGVMVAGFANRTRY